MRTYALLLGLAVLITVAPAVSAAQPRAAASPAAQEARGLITQFKAAADTPRTAAQLDPACAAIVAALLPDLESEDAGVRGNGLASLDDIVFFVGRPGAEAERLALCKAMAAKLGAAKPIAQPWFCRMLQYSGHGECVAALTPLLDNADADVRDSARRALLKNPAPEAGTALVAALAKADTPAGRIALINALGDRADPATVAALVRYVANKDEGVAAAAACAVGHVGGTDALNTLIAAKTTTTGKVQDAVFDGLLMAADGLVRQGNLDRAAAVYRVLDAPSSPARIRMAVLRGTIITGGDKALPALTTAVTGTDLVMRGFAISLLGEIRGPAATKTLIELMPKLPAANQTILLGDLATRNDPTVKPAVLEALKSPDEAVRVAAARAMATLGDASDVPALTQAAAAGGTTSDAFKALVQLRGDAVNAAMIQALSSPDAKVQAVLAAALSARKATAAAPALLKIATDAKENTGVEVVAALGVVGDESAMPTLVNMIVNSKSEADGKAAEKAAAAIAARSTKKAACAAPVLAALPAAKGPAKISLITVLGPTGTPDALVAIRAALKDASGDVQNAAVGALSAWPDATPAPDLLEIARSGPTPALQVLALRGYVRLAGSGNTPAADRVKMYENALAAAKQAQERSLVLSEMANVPSAAALVVIRPLLANEESKNEAANAIVKIATAIGTAAPNDAKAALQAVVDSTAADNFKQQARRALTALGGPAAAPRAGKAPTKS